jgi:hypothetical protein
MKNLHGELHRAYGPTKGYQETYLEDYKNIS